MSSSAFLKLELVSLLLVSHLLAFCSGLFLPMIQFDVPGFLEQMPFIYWAPILIGSLFFLLGIRDVIKRTISLVKPDSAA